MNIYNKYFKPAKFNNLDHARTYGWICATLLLFALVSTILLGFHSFNTKSKLPLTNILVVLPTNFTLWSINPTFWSHTTFCLIRALLSTKPVCLPTGLIYFWTMLLIRKVLWYIMHLFNYFVFSCQNSFANFPFWFPCTIGYVRIMWLCND